MTLVQQLFQDLKLTIGKPLKASGFVARHHKIFTKDLGDVMHLFQLQKSDSSTESMLVVTLNIGIICKSLAVKMKETPEEMDVWDCHWRERIGNLMPCKMDYWWNVGSAADAAIAGDAMVDAIQSYAFPVLRGLASKENLIALWKSETSPGITEFQRRKKRGHPCLLEQHRRKRSMIMSIPTKNLALPRLTKLQQSAPIEARAVRGMQPPYVPWGQRSIINIHVSFRKRHSI